MGLDIYAGTLARYYTHNWKTATQQFAEANGIKYQMIRQDDGNTPPPDEVLAEVIRWRDSIKDLFAPEEVPVWNEDIDVTPYYTDKPDWEALGALLLYISAKYLEKPVPPVVNKGDDAYGHPLVREFIEKKKSAVSLIDGDGCWVPVTAPAGLRTVMPNGEDGVAATIGLLKAELERYNSFEWNADRDTIVSWSVTEGYPADATIRGAAISEIEENTEYDTVSLAKFAFSILWQAAEFSLEHGTVVLLDY